MTAGKVSIFRSELPDCIEEDLKIIEDYFTEIDALASNWIVNIVGQHKSNWKSGNDVKKFSQMHYKVQFRYIIFIEFLMNLGIFLTRAPYINETYS